MMEPNMNPGEDKTTSGMIPKTLLADCMPGDTVKFKIKDFKGDMAEVEYMGHESDSDESSEMSPEDMNDPEKTDSMKDMPADKMRKRLPKADRY